MIKKYSMEDDKGPGQLQGSPPKCRDRVDLSLLQNKLVLNTEVFVF